MTHTPGTKKKTSFLRRFRRKEDGSVFVIEFVVMFPIMLLMFFMSVELGIYSMRHMFLDRGLDLTVRHIRLNTNTQMTHNDLKDMICERAGFLEDCSNSLRLEMAPLNPRAFAAFDPTPDCVDDPADLNPNRGIILGREHQMMIMRACYRFVPVFSTVGLGFAMNKESGRARMVSSALFVQEPN